MLVLLDHGTPRGIARALQGHIIKEAKAQGWDTLSNGAIRAGYAMVWQLGRQRKRRELRPHSCATHSMPLLTRNTCPSGCRRCISRTFHGMSAGGKVTSRPAATHCLWTASTSSTQTDIQAPLSAVWSPSGPNVEAFAPLPRPPWPPWQRKISHWPDPTAPKVGGVPQSQHFLQPHFSNQAKLAAMLETFSIGVTPFATMGRKDNTGVNERLNS